MSDYTILYNKFISKGYTEDTASKLAEVISDYGITNINNILNEVIQESEN